MVETLGIILFIALTIFFVSVLIMLSVVMYKLMKDILKDF